MTKLPTLLVLKDGSAHRFSGIHTLIYPYTHIPYTHNAYTHISIFHTHIMHTYVHMYVFQPSTRCAALDSLSTYNIGKWVSRERYVYYGELV